jgi:hypothetical protein
MVDPEALRRSLGLRPRGARDAPTEAPERKGSETPPKVAKQDAEEAAPITDPARKPVGKLPPEVQVMLRSFYVKRPEIDLPPHLHELSGTWGRYMGDARPTPREVPLGFRPAFILYIAPAYPQGGPKWVQKKGGKGGELVDPGLHDQPTPTDKGFVTLPECNKVNNHYIYIAWKSDPSKAPAPAPVLVQESTRDARRLAQVERRKKDLEERRKRARRR